MNKLISLLLLPWVNIKFIELQQKIILLIFKKVYNYLHIILSVTTIN